MSSLVLSEKDGKLTDVYFAYPKIKVPGNKYNSEEKEYSVDVVVDKATAKEMKKKFPKNGVKEIDNDDFENVFKFAPPFPEQDSQYVLKFKTAYLGKDGQPKPYEWGIRPKIYVPGEKGIKDVTMDKRVGNGSKGDLAFNFTTTSFGTVHFLSAILVREMIELESRPATPFGEVEPSAEMFDGEEEKEDSLGF